MRAIPYIRWSSDKQALGSSLERQTTTITDYIAAKGWTLAPADEWIRDEGVSGYFGDNVADTGGLGKFLAKVKRDGGHDLAIVAEQLDRLSRLETIRVIRLIDALTQTGLTVVLADNKMIIDAQSLENQTDQLDQIVADTKRAHAEGARKSVLSRAAWVAIREGMPIRADRAGVIERVDRFDYGVDITASAKRASTVYELSKLDDGFSPRVGDTVDVDQPLGMVVRKTHVSATCPAWLTITPCRRAFGRDESRIAVLRMIFEHYADGVSFKDICRELNEGGVKPWRGGRHWGTSTIKTLIASRAVIGEYQHQSRATGQTIGDPDPAYFPQVISNELFQAANNARHKIVMGGRGREVAHRNLFAQVAQCGACGSKMRFNRKTDRTADTRGRTYYQCSSYDLKTGCDAKQMYRGNPIEDALLDHILSLALDDQHFSNDGEASALAMLLADQRRALDDIGARLDNLAANMAGRVDERLQRQYDALSDQEAKAKAVVEETEQRLAMARGAVDPATHLKRVADIREDMYGDDEAAALRARKTVALAINDIVQDMRFSPSRNLVSVSLIDRLRYFEIKDGRVIEDVDFVEMFPDERVNGRSLPVTVRFAGKTTEKNIITAEMVDAADAYLRRHS